MKIQVLCIAILASAGQVNVVAGQTPDVLLIMLDDAGYSDFGCYGSQIETPNIDQLAATGMRFTDCHAAAPNCSPSRAGMLTGRFPSRMGVYSYIPAGHPMHLPNDEATIAEILKNHGYATGHFGKWHLSQLGSTTQPQPSDQGFDYSLGTTNNARPSHKDPNNFIRNSQPLGVVEGFSCEIVVDEACQWLDSLAPQQRFFACVWFHEPHAKIASPQELIQKYNRLFPGISNKQANYYANIENVDRMVKRLLSKLDELDRSRNTFVFLTSDNGGVNPWSNRGLRGRKSFVYEGGHREPAIARWPGQIKAGSVSDQLISHLDLLPTICDITGAQQPKEKAVDGANLVPLLTGGSLARKTPLFWYFYRVKPAAAMRDGQWVILGYLDDPIEKHTHALTRPDMPMIKSAQLDRFELYNLESDPLQTTDLSEAQPQRLNRMKQEMVRLHQDVVAEGTTWQLNK